MSAGDGPAGTEGDLFSCIQIRTPCVQIASVWARYTNPHTQTQRQTERERKGSKMLHKRLLLRPLTGLSSSPWLSRGLWPSFSTSLRFCTVSRLFYLSGTKVIAVTLEGKRVSVASDSRTSCLGVLLPEMSFSCVAAAPFMRETQLNWWWKLNSDMLGGFSRNSSTFCFILFLTLFWLLCRSCDCVSRLQRRWD